MIVYELIPKLIRAALNNDKKAVESISLMIGRKIKRVSSNSIGNYANNRQ